MDWRLPIADRMNCQRENSASHSFLNWIHADSTLLRIRFRWTFEPSGLQHTEASVSFAKGATSHNQLEFCWNTAGGHLPLSPNGTTDVFCATQKGANSMSEQSFPVLPCPPTTFHKTQLSSSLLLLGCREQTTNTPGPKNSSVCSMAQQTSGMQQIGHVLWCPWHYRGEKKAINIPPYHSEIYQMLQSLLDSNTSHISEVVCIISLPDTVVKWFGEIRRDFHRMAQFSYFTGSQDGWGWRVPLAHLLLKQG